MFVIYEHVCASGHALMSGSNIAKLYLCVLMCTQVQINEIILLIYGKFVDKGGCGYEVRVRAFHCRRLVGQHLIRLV